MKKAMIIGNVNVGKTLFMLNFAQYLGVKKLMINFHYPEGKVLNKEISIDNAVKELSSDNPHKTKCLQKINIKIKVYKGNKEIRIIDSCGLTNGIHPDYYIREGIIQTLESIKDAHIIIHMVDVSRFILDRSNFLTELDRQIIEYGKLKGKYVLLANKIDLDSKGQGIRFLIDNFNDVYIIPISALHKRGFDEVKNFVVNCL